MHREIQPPFPPMTNYDLFIIDPQNDFMDTPGAALPVPGAVADMERLAHWLRRSSKRVESLTVTLDSHASVGIERTTFWLDAQGAAVQPFTMITSDDVHGGKYRPRRADLMQEVLTYLKALETAGRHQLIVWPVHCVTGTWGHNIYPPLAQCIAAWELETGRFCAKVLKGIHPLTEQYSAFRAEVPRADDTSTQLNVQLLDRLATAQGVLLIAGEAQSHCVAASVHDMITHLPASRLKNTLLLRDCMSPVVGFEDAAASFMQQAQRAGLHGTLVSELV